PAFGKPVQPDPNYLTREDAAGAIQELLGYQRKGMKIAAQHQKLFGQFLEDDIIGEAMAVNQDPEMYYRAKYNISAKEAEIAARIREQEIAKIREEERAKIMAEVTSDPGRLVGQSAFPGMISSSVQDNYMKQAAQARNPIADTGDQGQRLLP